MPAVRDCKVLGQYGEGVHQQLILLHDGQGMLLSWAIAVAKETGTFLYHLFADVGPSTDYAGWIPLGAKPSSDSLGGECFCLYVFQRLIASGGVRPVFFFALKEILYFCGGRYPFSALVELLASQNLKGTQVVLISIVLVYLVLTQGCIAISLPAAAEIDLVIQAAYMVTSADHQAKSIVLAIAGIRNLYLPEYWGVEGARCTQTIDAQGIVAPIVGCPLLMVDEAWRQGVQLEVAHAVRTDNHSGLLLAEGIHHLLQGLG